MTCLPVCLPPARQADRQAAGQEAKLERSAQRARLQPGGDVGSVYMKRAVNPSARHGVACDDVLPGAVNS